MATKKHVEDAIFTKEGFYVRMHLLDPKTKSLPEYAFEFMASNKWKISDWKNERLKAYWTLVKSIDVYRGDDTIVKSDLKLAGLRDSYFDAHYDDPTSIDPNDELAARRKR
ncbi:MAG: hypothetical protein M3N19_04775 [Candidatus Eremiobacteraeota bacterium]|nr:hypothetical protein [Candidatus Eremiobacteraeota bacterium]